MVRRETLSRKIRLIPIWIVYVSGIVPGFFLFVNGYRNSLGPDPVKVIEHELGSYALKFLLVVLFITPIDKTFKLGLTKYRRAIGLLSFWYALAHVLSYIILDKQFYWDEIGKDLIKRPFIILGFLSFSILLVLAITSNNWSIRRLGGLVWKKLHLFVYVATLLAAIHFVMLVKAWPMEPLVYLTLILSLIIYRVIRSKI